MKKRTILIALAILALGLIGTGLSALYERDEFIVTNFPKGTRKVSYGFPLDWHGYSFQEGGLPSFLPNPPPRIYWFSLESFLLDAAFWFAISFLICTATMKALNMSHQRGASKNLSVINI